MLCGSLQNLPAELLYPTIEYILPPSSSLPSSASAAAAAATAAGTQLLPPPLFVLVLDTCIIEEEVEQLKDSLLQVFVMLWVWLPLVIWSCCCCCCRAAAGGLCTLCVASYTGYLFFDRCCFARICSAVPTSVTFVTIACVARKSC